MFTFVWNILKNTVPNSSSSQQGKVQPQRCNSSGRNKRLRMEHLESRDLLSIAPADLELVRSAFPGYEIPENANYYEVTSNLSEGPGTLRDAIIQAQSTYADDDIIFIRPEVDHIKLTQSLEILYSAQASGTVTIIGTGLEATTIDGQNNVRVFDVGHSAAVNIANVHITNGLSANPSMYTGRYDGGGLYAYCATVSLNDVVFSDNATASWGGGYDFGGGMAQHGGSSYLENVRFIGNSSLQGGGFGLRAGGTTVQNGVEYVNNQTYESNPANWGGGMFIDNSTATLSNLLVHNNTSRHGGGIAAFASSLELVNSTITQNATTLVGEFVSGSGLYIDPHWRTVNVNSSTRVYNTILLGNEGNSDLCLNEEAYSFVDFGNNIIGGYSTWYEQLSLLTENNLFGADVWDVFEENGYFLAADSPALNAGRNDKALQLELETDIFGNIRIQDGQVDIGAVESSGEIVEVLVPAPQPTNLSSWISPDFDNEQLIVNLSGYLPEMNGLEYSVEISPNGIDGWTEETYQGSVVRDNKYFGLRVIAPENAFGSTYYYRIIVGGKGLTPSYSEPIAVTFQEAPQLAPVEIQAFMSSPSHTKVTWTTTVPRHEYLCYELERAPRGTDNWEHVTRREMTYSNSVTFSWSFAQSLDGPWYDYRVVTKGLGAGTVVSEVVTPDPYVPPHDLYFEAPANWGDAVVIGKSGVYSGSTEFSANAATGLYLNYAFHRDGDAVVTSPSIKIYRNDSLVTTQTKSLNTSSGLYTGNYYLGTLAAGTYTFRVVLDSGNILDEYNETNNEYTIAVTVYGAPDAPTGLVAEVPEISDGIPGDSVQLQWNAVERATLYRVDYNYNGNWYSAGTTTETQMTLNSLYPQTEYRFRVVAVNINGASPASPFITVKTGWRNPAKPGMSVSSATTSSITLRTTFTISANVSGYLIEQASSPDGPWVCVYESTISESTTSSIAKTATISGLLSDTTYYFRTRAVNALGESESSAVVSRSTIAAPPMVPQGVKVETLDDSTLVVSWDASEKAAQYTIEQILGNTVTRLTTTETSYTFNSLLPNTAYQFRVSASNGTGSSAYSESVSAKTDWALPVTPTLSVSSTELNTVTLLLGFSSMNGNSETYTLEQATTLEGPWTAFSQTEVPSAGAASATITGLQDGTTYYFRACTSNPRGDSSYSDVVSATTKLASPQAPTGLNAWIGSSRVYLSWNSSAKASYYTVQYMDGEGTLLGSYNTTNTSYSVFYANLHSEYRFVVQAVNSGGTSPKSQELHLITPPQGVSGRPMIAHGEMANTIAVSWSAAQYAETYTVERQILNYDSLGTWTTVYEGSQTNFIDTTLPDPGKIQGTQVFYRYSAYNAGGHSGWSSDAIISMPLLLPDAPANLTLTPQSSTQIAAQWDAVEGATSYSLWRMVAANTWRNIYTGTATNYVDSGLSVSTQYTYQVKAHNEYGGTPYSKLVPVSATTLDRVTLSAPEDLTANVRSSTSIQLTWNAVSGAESYILQRRDSSTGAWKTVYSGNATEFLNTGLKANSMYQYQVLAQNGSDPSDYSQSISVQTQKNKTPNAPVDLKLISSGETSLTVQWTDSSTDETGFIVRWSTDGKTWKSVTTNANVTNHTISGLTSGTTYFVQVQATNKFGTSALTPQIEAATGTPEPLKAPAVPQNFKVESQTHNFVVLSMSVPAKSDTIVIQRATSTSGPWSTIATLAAGTHEQLQWTDTNLTAETTYFYHVLARNAAGDSAWTSPLSVTTKAAPVRPEAPTDLKVVSIANNSKSFDVAWINTAVENTGFRVEYSTDDGTTWSSVIVPANQTELTINGMKKKTTVQVRVATTHGELISDYSETLKFTI